MLKMLPVHSISPNSHNPNCMTPDQFAELVEEVRHLGRVPKPVVVTPAGERWEIVDGEHGWRAAAEAGLSDVLCEIVAVDRFEAMRQTFKRNQHGRHQPVRLGRMFLLMMEERGLSQRELAAAVVLSEGTIRNAILYATAAGLRQAHAAKWQIDCDGIDDLIGQLTVRQVREYVQLPEGIRDEWLDSGADLEVLRRATVVRVEERGKVRTIDFGDRSTGVDFWRELTDAGLGDRVRGCHFIWSTHEAAKLLMYRRQHGCAIEAFDDYLRPIVEGMLPSCVLDELPCRDKHGRTEMLLSPRRWAEILADCARRTMDPVQLQALIRVSIRLAVEDSGAAGDDVTDPRTIACRRALSRSPAFLRDATLPLADRYEFALLLADGGADAGDLADVVRRACHLLEVIHNAAAVEAFPNLSPAMLPLLQDPTPAVALRIATEDAKQERHDARLREIVLNRALLTEALLERLSEQLPAPEVSTGLDGRSVRALMADRISRLPDSELRLLGGAILGWAGTTADWLRAASAEALTSTDA